MQCFRQTTAVVSRNAARNAAFKNGAVRCFSDAPARGRSYEAEDLGDETSHFKGVKKPEIQEIFEDPVWWNDFPEGFDDEMKHEVEKLQIFADLAPLLDGKYSSHQHLNIMCT